LFFVQVNIPKKLVVSARLCKTLIKPIVCNGSVTWTLTPTAKQMLNTFERKILRRIYGPTQEGGDADVPDGTVNLTVFTVSQTSWRTLKSED